MIKILNLNHVYLIILCLVPYQLFSQSIDNLQKKIDSLEDKKLKINENLKAIDLELIKLKNQKEILKSKDDSINPIVGITISSTKLTDKGTSFANELIYVPKNKEVTLISWKSHYFKVSYNNTIGYIHEMYISTSSENVKNFIKYFEIKEEHENQVAREEEERNKIEAKKRLKERFEESERKQEEEFLLKTEKQRNLGLPIYIETAAVTFNSIDNPEAVIYIANISQDTIDAYTVNIYCQDRFNNAVKHYSSGSNVFSGISQNTLNPKESTMAMWTLYGHENTAKIKVYISKVHFTNGKTWYPNANQKILVEGTSTR